MYHKRKKVVKQRVWRTYVKNHHLPKTHLLDLSAGRPTTQGKWQTIHSNQLLRTAVHCLTTQEAVAKSQTLAEGGPKNERRSL
jgi:hypothetical protein